MATFEWGLSSAVLHLNHGSFGLCPQPVAAYQKELRAYIDTDPDKFFFTEAEDRLRQAKIPLAKMLHTSAENIVWVRNATSGINAALKSLSFKKGDEILITDHIYNACKNVVDYVCEVSGAHSTVVSLPFPLMSETQLAEALISQLKSETKIVMLDHLTSATALVLPLHLILPELRKRGIESLIDGAHAPGQIPVNLDLLGATYYTGNCHKWLFSPRGAAFLYVDPTRQDKIHPSVISHGSNDNNPRISSFQRRFKWPGTDDLTSLLSVPRAMKIPEEIGFADWNGLMARNHKLACDAREMLCKELKVSKPCPDLMLGAMAAVALPERMNSFIEKLQAPTNIPAEAVHLTHFFDEPRWRLWHFLHEQHGISTVVNTIPGDPRYFLRISAQAYNTVEDYVRLARVLSEISK